MPEQRIWMVRAGRGAEFVDEFIDENIVAIGWNNIGSLSNHPEKSEIAAKLAEDNPKASKGTIAVWAAQIKRYYDEVKIGDLATTYDPNQRVYFLGEILSGIEHRDHALSRVRRVRWEKKVARNSLATSTRNSLGSIATLFQVKGDAARDMLKHAVPIETTLADQQVEAYSKDLQDDDRILMEEVATRADEFIEDRIARLDWPQMQELVAEILRAMGYRARVSPSGPDRGVDVFASPDGLGLQEPRIFVEVKHRPGSQIGTNDIRAFLGGRKPGDRCLYVSTGGFSKEARYEADRSPVPITLITLPRLRELVVEYYDELNATGKALVPLERLYWPLS